MTPPKQQISLIPFLSRIRTLTSDIDIANLSVCPSVRVRLSFCPGLDENGLTYCDSFFSPYVR